MLTLLAAAVVAAAAPSAKIETPLYMAPNGAPMILPKQIGSCGGMRGAMVCSIESGQVYLRLEVPPCKTPEANTAGRCVPWEISADPRFQTFAPGAVQK